MDIIKLNEHEPSKPSVKDFSIWGMSHPFLQVACRTFRFLYRWSRFHMDSGSRFYLHCMPLFLPDNLEINKQIFLAIPELHRKRTRLFHYRYWQCPIFCPAKLLNFTRQSQEAYSQMCAGEMENQFDSHMHCMNYVYTYVYMYACTLSCACTYVYIDRWMKMKEEILTVRLFAQQLTSSLCCS